MANNNSFAEIAKIHLVTQLEFAISSVLAALNKKLVAVDGWQPVDSGFSATLRESIGNRVSESKTLWADVVPAGWPEKTSNICVRLDLYPNGKWVPTTVSVIAHHITIDGNYLDDLRLDVTYVCGFTFLSLASSELPSIQAAFARR